MPTPRTFSTRDELVKALRHYDWSSWIRRGRRTEQNTSLDEIIRTAVMGNTFRAFHFMKHPPAEVFRKWARGALNDNRLTVLQNISSQRQYTDWLYRFALGFRVYWHRAMGQEMPFGPSMKLPNLLAKRLLFYSNLPDKAVERLIWVLDVPLDSYTLQAVANIFDSFPNAAAIGRIPSSATMNFVSDLNMYEAFQEGIRRLAKEAGVPPIILDCVAWDVAHEKKSVLKKPRTMAATRN